MMKVLVAIDTSPFALKVIDAVCTRRWPDDCQFLIVTVFELSTGWFSQVDPPGTDEELKMVAELEAYVYEVSMQLKKRLPTHQIFSEVLRGSASSQIVRGAREWDADLIVLGQQGTAGAGGRSLGGIAEAVVQYARCSVEVVKPKVQVHSLGKQVAAVR
jgi:nucleotide-binding universal stress UspA family protein